MKQDLHRRILETMARHGMIRPGDRVGLGVSGGADSVAMLRVFAELRPQLGIAILVLHFNHQLRGLEANEDERFVKVLAEEFHLEFESGRADVVAEARRHGWNLEDAARRLRYQFFGSVAEARGLNRVAVAHTANDQAETVLLHLLRGTGLAGLAGIYPVAGLVIRPLLEVGRGELRAYLAGLGQSWREDASNQDTSRTRARIRHELIPHLIQNYDAAAVARLARLAKHARENEAFWRALEDERFHALTLREASDAISVSVEDLLSPLPLLKPSRGSGKDSMLPSFPANPSSTMALSRRLVRRIFAELRGSREQLTSRHVDSAMALARQSQSGARIDLPGARVERIFERLHFTSVFAAVDAARSAEPQRATDKGFAYKVSRPEHRQSASIVVTELHRRFSLKKVDWPLAPSDTVRDGDALDFDRVEWPLVLRNWHPGDSYRPRGSRHARKLKRLLLNSRIPRNARGNWPVLTSQGKVIWASGYPVAAEMAADVGTQTGLVVSEEEL